MREKIIDFNYNSENDNISPNCRIREGVLLVRSDTILADMCKFGEEYKRLSRVKSILNGMILSLRNRKPSCNAWMQPNGKKRTDKSC